MKRIWREIDVLRVCQQVTNSNAIASPLTAETPELLFEDRENYLFAMSAAPPDHVVWKSELLAGRASTDIAETCGALLGCLHTRTWHNSGVARQLDDRQFFDDLRLDPYYRQIARVHPDLKPAVDQLIESVCSQRHCG